MPRTARIAPGGMVFHVLNRANNRDEMFEKDEDYLAFLRVLGDTLRIKPMRILAYCLMPNHWHLLLWPERDNDLGNFMQALTTTHVRRWRLHLRTVGEGHLCQGTYKSFRPSSSEEAMLVAAEGGFVIEYNRIKIKIRDCCTREMLLDDFIELQYLLRLQLHNGQVLPVESDGGKLGWQYN